MILCPNCQHQNVPGSLFCSECGSRLVSQVELNTQSIKRTPSDMLATELPPPRSVPAAVPQEEADTVISLLIIETGQVLHLAGRNEFTIGRVSEGQPILPDVDLTPYNAFNLGVSRLHVSMKLTRTGVIVTDLGSSNGTRVNGQKIVPHVEYPINHGDTVAIGKLKLKILIHR
jgi:pSer/pThr/pTyr-binding forkhead associated (FHA) protein